MRSDLHLPEGYQERGEVPHFDDTPLKDEWQDEVYSYARRVVEMEGLTSVLDLGCGSGFKLLKHFSDLGIRMCGAEVEPTLSWLRRTYPDNVWLDASRLGSAQQFDAVICSDVIEHVQNPIALIKTILSVKPKLVVISTPDAEMMGRPLGPPRNKHHVREWSMEGFYNLLSDHMVVVQHLISNHEQCTQMAVCEPKA